MDPSVPPIDYRAFLESTPLVPWELDPCSRRMNYVGPQAVALLGYPLDAWLEPDFWTEHILPDDQMEVLSARATLAKDGGSHVIEYRMEHRDGHLVWVSEAAHAVKPGDSICCLRGLLNDVTERKRLEESLAHSEAHLRAVLTSAPDALVLTDTNGSILAWNDQAEFLFGYSEAEVVGSCIDLLVPERLRDRFVSHRRAFAQDLARRSMVDGTRVSIVRLDGEEVPVEVGVSRVAAPAGSRLLYSIRDLTPRLRVEAQERASEERLRGVAESLPALVCFVGADQRYRFVNEQYAEWAGWSKGDVVGRRVSDVLGAEIYAKVRPSIEAALGGQAVHFQADVLAQGRQIAVDVSYVPQWEGDSVTGYFVVVVELSARAVSAASDSAAISS